MKKFVFTGVFLCLFIHTSQAGTSPIYESEPLISMQGNILDFSSFKGSPLVLVFWANWCVPCRKEVPQINALYQYLTPKNVNLIGINEDEKKEQGLAFIHRYRPQYASIQDKDFSWALKMGVKSLPQVIVLSAEGKELYRSVEPPSIHKLQRLIEEKP